MTLEEAYGECRAIAKREAKNFYYAFRVLPRAKSDAMCAVYAFMRKADDLADDEGRTIEERRAALAEWRASWRVRRMSGARQSVTPEADEAVFLALADTQERYGISDELLEQLVDGTAMDLGGDTDRRTQINVATTVAAGTTPQTVSGFESFPDLYRYCYLVASVVGFVCIKIFGYSDPAAEALAEKTGVAFQLTNILRDVKEDAERGRIYIPQEMLREFAVTNEDLLGLTQGVAIRANERAMIVALSVQAWGYYKAAQELLPLIDADSRAALWVLVEIYSGLLSKIDERQGDVFSSRVSLPASKKMFVLLRGAAKAARSGRG